jgi:prepilin-type processing-associated H-X9-DG protein
MRGLRRSVCPVHPTNRILAFSLIEVFVALALAAVLTALLFPLLRAARERPRTARCISQLRQLYAGFSLYALDHDGRLPPYQNLIGLAYARSESGPKIPIPERGRRLVESLRPYVSSPSLWFCPNDPYARTDSEAGGIRHRHASYRTGLWTGMESVTGEETTAEGPVRLLNRAGAASIVLLSDNLLWPCFPGECPAPPYGHGGRFNTLYFDGHADTRRFKLENVLSQ